VDAADTGRVRWRRALGIVGLIWILLIAGLVWATVFRDDEDREEEAARSWLSRQAVRVPVQLITNEEVPAAGLARVMVRPDSGWLPLHRWVWDNAPKSLRAVLGLPRPRDSRWNGIFARAWLDRHEQRPQALPVLLAAATDPTRANAAAVMSCLRSFGTLDPWLAGDVQLRSVEQGLQGLQDRNPAVRLQMLRRFASAWPTDPTLRRRMEALQREVGDREFQVTPPVKPGTVPAN
jgi:hypothetical protein